MFRTLNRRMHCTYFTHFASHAARTRTALPRTRARARPTRLCILYYTTGHTHHCFLLPRARTAARMACICDIYWAYTHYYLHFFAQATPTLSPSTISNFSVSLINTIDLKIIISDTWRELMSLLSVDLYASVSLHYM